MHAWDEVWRFETPRFAVIAEVTDCDTDPAGQFSDQRDVDMIRNGECAWFDARVRIVLRDTGETLGADYLGGCAYAKPADLFRHHASYTAELRDLRARHARLLRQARRWPPRSRTADLAQAGQVRREIAQIKEILRNNAMLSPAVCFGEYGPDMVRSAIDDARKHIAKLADLHLRETV